MNTNLVSFSPTRAAMLVALLGAVATGTKAEAAGKRAGVPKFEGPQEAIVRKQVMAVLKAHGFELVKSRQMEAAVQSSGGQLESDDGFQKVAKELALTVIVTGEVGKKKAKLMVHDGREGSLLGQAAFPGANPRKVAGDVRRAFWAKLGKDIAKGHVPSGSKAPQAVAEAPDEAESAPEPAEESGSSGGSSSGSSEKSGEASASDDSGSSHGDDSSRSSARRKKAKEASGDENAVVAEGSSESGGNSPFPVLEVSGSGAGLNRQYVYNQQVSGLRNHSLPLGPAVVFDGVWYPLGSIAPGLEHLGVQAALEQEFGIQSGITGGTTYSNKAHEYEGGLRYRIPFGENQAWISGSGGEHAFLFTGRGGANDAGLNVPDTIYRYARAGVGLRFTLTPLISFSVGAGYRYIFNHAGPQFQSLFPHATVGGVDGEVAVGIRVMEGLQIRVAGEMRRYFSSMHSVAADQFKAGGAIDQYLSFGVGLTYTYGGTGGPAVASAEEEAAPAPKKAASKSDDDEDSDSKGEGNKGEAKKKGASGDEDSGGDSE